jgi:hypothetical protein
MPQVRNSGLDATSHYFRSIYDGQQFMSMSFDAAAFEPSPVTQWPYCAWLHLMELLTDSALSFNKSDQKFVINFQLEEHCRVGDAAADYFDCELQFETLDSHAVIKITSCARKSTDRYDDDNHALQLDNMLKGRSVVLHNEEVTLLFFEQVKVMFVPEIGSLSDSDDSSSDVSTDYVFQIESVSLDDDDSDNESVSDSEEEQSFAWATFKNVPVQLTIMEKLDGTLYDLFTKFPDSTKHFAWLAQIVFALAYAQRTFGLTHNDLHGNNIMYTKTDLEFLYYSYSSDIYAVPTFGYILKIIDFDRGIGSIKVQGMKEARTFMSDQFHEDEEAGGQYNVEPFYNNHFQVIKPNPSFDLVRLATSIFWDLFPNGPKYEEYSENLVYKLFMKWLTLPDGSSILFHKNNPKIDRYFGFNLYKAIARYCKDVIPRKEISEFKCFIVDCPVASNLLTIEM